MWLVWQWAVIASSLNDDDATRASSVNTECGAVEGVVEGGVHVFKGIRYAQPPVAERRWSPPVSLADAGLCWNGTSSATKFGAACPQNPGSLDIGHTDEDCLYLNVWSPNVSAAARLPVMVWVHGGGYVFGSGNYPNYIPILDG